MCSLFNLLVWLLAFWCQVSAVVIWPSPLAAELCVDECGCVEDFGSYQEFLECAASAHGKARAPTLDARDWTVTSTPTATTTPISTFSPTPAPNVTQSQTSTSHSSTLSWDNCFKGGPCDCEDIDDDDGWAFFQCITNPNCEHCWMGSSLSTLTSSVKSTTFMSLAKASMNTTWPPEDTTTSTIRSTSTMTITVSTTTRRTPPDNCYVDGPCDCSLIEDKNSREYFRCITNPACEHCWMSLEPHDTIFDAVADSNYSGNTDFRSSHSY